MEFKEGRLTVAGDCNCFQLDTSLEVWRGMQKPQVMIKKVLEEFQLMDTRRVKHTNSRDYMYNSLVHLVILFKSRIYCTRTPVVGFFF